jgi:adenylate cyclase
MFKVQVKSLDEVKNSYAELAGALKEHDQIIITNEGISEAVLIGVEDYAEYEKYARKKDVRERLETLQAQPAARLLPKVTRPIGVKLVAIITGLLLVSLVAITVMMSMLVSADVQLTAEDSNFNINRRTSQAVNAALGNIRSAVSSLLNDLAIIDPSAAESAVPEFFFVTNPHIAAVMVLDAAGAAPSVRLINADFFRYTKGEPSLVDLFLESEGGENGESGISNASPLFGLPLLVLTFPLADKSAASVFFSAESLTPFFGDGDNVSFMLNDAGAVLVHPDRELMDSGANLMRLPFVRSALESTGQDIQTLYTDERGNQYFGAFQRIPLGAATVLTIIPSATVFKGIAATTRRTIMLSSAVLALSVLFIILFSSSISKPLKALTHAAGSIEEGNYDLRLSHKSRDEIGVLTQTFTGMGYGLANFEKFTNKTIVQLARQGKLTRTGINKTATICFALIRDFSEMTEAFEAQEVVAFVNEYLKRMVPCITATGGIVDKFLTQGGVVVMALWGTATSAGSATEDALNCIKSVLMMRASLRSLNEDRSKEAAVPLIKIGCGINSGEVVAGQMGSDERMEYTVIGDAVNLAARIEGPNDLFDTDILITEETWNLVGGRLITEEMPSLEVKGKEKPLRIWTVVNVREASEGEALLATLERLPGTNSRLSRHCVGADGSQAMAEVRKRWR